MEGADTLDGKPGYRVRSRAYGAHISQGCLFDVNEFPEITTILETHIRTVGREAAVAEFMRISFEGMLGVKKWRPVLDVTDEGWLVLGRPPDFIIQPSCERAQNYIGLFTYENMRKEWQVTEKLDGKSMTFYKVKKGERWHKALPPVPEHLADDYLQMVESQDFRIGVCSRKHEMVADPENPYWAAILPWHQQIFKIAPNNIAVQGELVGWDIENNSMGWEEGERHFIVFDIMNLDTGKLMPPSMVEATCEQLNIPHVPVLNEVVLGEFAQDMDELLAKAEGKSQLGSGEIREGLVFKSADGQQQFKVISNTWLVKTGK
jgi:RNA ligase (TIGR02306 family)